MVNWTAWRLDFWTFAWVSWILWFVVLETVALALRSQNELTAHLRPAFQFNDLAWFLALGAWLWLGFHFLVDGIFVRREISP